MSCMSIEHYQDYEHLSCETLPHELLSAEPWNNAAEDFDRGQTQRMNVIPT